MKWGKHGVETFNMVLWIFTWESTKLASSLYHLKHSRLHLKFGIIPNTGYIIPRLKLYIFDDAYSPIGLFRSWKIRMECSIPRVALGFWFRGTPSLFVILSSSCRLCLISPYLCRNVCSISGLNSNSWFSFSLINLSHMLRVTHESTKTELFAWNQHTC